MVQKKVMRITVLEVLYTFSGRSYFNLSAFREISLTTNKSALKMYLNFPTNCSVCVETWCVIVA